jgi:hypothetical protein
MTGRVLHFGKYDGMDIDEVVARDPAYILWAADNVPALGITQQHVDRALAELSDNSDGDFELAAYALDDFADLMGEGSPWGRDSE